MLNTKHKRLLALILAALMLCLAVLPAFAEGENGKDEAQKDEPWRGFLRILGAIASYAFVIGIIVIGVVFFIARVKTGRRGY
ncbi:hypothetical protein SDC9_66791 [bioreactor metagenome]|uniref:Uncharacterized protein n=1 Tax=bioreactor metagenome TaxID=1076179 RepID=A0A644XVW4_9ZZZZ